MYAKIANQKKKHKIFANNFPTPRHRALYVSWLFAKLILRGWD